jgi:hypothetical protein
MNAANQVLRAWGVALLLASVAGFDVTAQSTNSTASTSARLEPATGRLDESAFRIVAERNIFNATRSGAGEVRVPSRRPSTVEYFTLVGTMDYEKGTFAFFDGSSSQYTKVIQADSVIAGHKLLDVTANSVKLEAEGKEIELPVGSQMRREDEGAWQVAEARRGLSVASNGNGDSSGRSDRSDRNDSSSRYRRNDSSESSTHSSGSTASSSESEDEILKRLMERRAKESQ